MVSLMLWCRGEYPIVNRQGRKGQIRMVEFTVPYTECGRDGNNIVACAQQGERNGGCQDLRQDIHEGGSVRHAYNPFW